MSHITILDTSIRQDNHGRYCLNDLHRAAGGAEKHKPANFLRADGVQAFLTELDETAEARGFPSVQSFNGGKSPGTYAIAPVAVDYAAWIGSESSAEFIRKLCGDHVVVKARRPEFAFGDDVVHRLFDGYKVISQFPVFGGKYRIDWYVPELRLAIEFDEKHHNSPRNAKCDADRQAEIERALGCRFLRYKFP